MWKWIPVLEQDSYHSFFLLLSSSQSDTFFDDLLPLKPFFLDPPPPPQIPHTPLPSVSWKMDSPFISSYFWNLCDIPPADLKPDGNSFGPRESNPFYFQLYWNLSFWLWTFGVCINCVKEFLFWILIFIFVINFCLAYTKKENKSEVFMDLLERLTVLIGSNVSAKHTYIIMLKGSIMGIWLMFVPLWKANSDIYINENLKIMVYFLFRHHTNSVISTINNWQYCLKPRMARMEKNAPNISQTFLW